MKSAVDVSIQACFDESDWQIIDHTRHDLEHNILDDHRSSGAHGFERICPAPRKTIKSAVQIKIQSLEIAIGKQQVELRHPSGILKASSLYRLYNLAGDSPIDRCVNGKPLWFTVTASDDI